MKVGVTISIDGDRFGFDITELANITEAAIREYGIDGVQELCKKHGFVLVAETAPQDLEITSVEVVSDDRQEPVLIDSEKSHHVKYVEETGFIGDMVVAVGTWIWFDEIGSVGGVRETEQQALDAVSEYGKTL